MRMNGNENIVVESALNKNTLLYGNLDTSDYNKNIGPSCVDMRGEVVDIVVTKCDENTAK